jgi:hypothetical protein
MVFSARQLSNATPALGLLAADDAHDTLGTAIHVDSIVRGRCKNPELSGLVLKGQPIVFQNTDKSFEAFNQELSA